MPLDSIEFMERLSSLNPRYIVNHSNRSVCHFENALLYLMTKKLVPNDKAEDILSQYKEFSRKLRTDKKHESMNFGSS